MLIQAHGIARGHHGGCFALLDDRGTLDALARRQRIAVVHRHFDEALAEPRLARALLLASHGNGYRMIYENLGQRPEHAHTPADGLDRGARVERGVTLGIDL